MATPHEADEAQDEGLTTLSDLHKLEERYPFDEAELEILVRCHDHLKQKETSSASGAAGAGDDFLLQLALASPFSSYFLPGNELRERVVWLEDRVLPAGFSNELRAALAADAFVEYANQGNRDRSLERFLEGVADTGRRGSKEALRVVYNLVGGEYAKAYDVVDVCFRLAIAADALSEPNPDRPATEARLNQGLDDVVQAVSQSLTRAVGGSSDENDQADKDDDDDDTSKDDTPFTLQQFVTWAEDNYPMLSSPLSTFVHHLVFHGHPYPKGRLEYACPRLDHTSDVFFSSASSTESSKPLPLTALSFATPQLGGKWHRLYSSEMDGRSFNRLEWALLGYGGPTVLAIKTTCDAVLGAFVAVPWKQSRDFYGNRDFFLFQLQPHAEVFHATGGDENFMYVHSREVHGPMSSAAEGGTTPHGIGFGGCFEQPRLFVPESFEHCTGDFLDRTYESGSLLPTDSLEKFEIRSLEVWGVGGDAVVTQALRARAEYRERTDQMRHEDQVVHDKSFIAKDMKSGLLEGHLFEHRDVVRGRPEFHVDDEHGGYKVEEDP